MITATSVGGGVVNLAGKQGTTWEIIASFFSDEAKTVPLDLTGYSARGQYRQDHNSQVKLIDLVSTVLTDGDKNQISIRVEASVSAACQVLSGVYDVEIYNSDESSVERVMEGTLTISPEVTRG